MKRLALILLCTAFCVSAQAANPPASVAPKRVNKAIELLESGQAVYYFYGKGGYEEGKAAAKTSPNWPNKTPTIPARPKAVTWDG